MHLVAGDTERAQVLQLAQATALVDGADVVGVPRIPFQALPHQLLGSLLETARGKTGRQLLQLLLAPGFPVARALLDHPDAAQQSHLLTRLPLKRGPRWQGQFGRPSLFCEAGRTSHPPDSSEHLPTICLMLEDSLGSSGLCERC